MQHTKVAARWLAGNAATFNGAVTLPVAATFDDDDVRRWVRRAEADDATYEQLRDATLVDFDSEADVLLFMRLMQGMNINVNVSLRGLEYIRNNAFV